MTLHDHPPGFVLCWPNNLFLYYKGKGHWLFSRDWNANSFFLYMYSSLKYKTLRLVIMKGGELLKTGGIGDFNGILMKIEADYLVWVSLWCNVMST